MLKMKSDKRELLCPELNSKPDICSPVSSSIKFNKTKTGFTLAEVLITIAIIGIVAALTIITLINNSQKAQYYTAFQKGYAELTEIVESLVLENGDMTSAITSYGGLTNAIRSKVKEGKFCKDSLPYGTCMSSSVKFSKDTTDNFDGYDMVVLADGEAIAIQALSDDCTYTSGNLTDMCGAFYLDTNGVKPPNEAGRDVFFFFIRNKKLTAEGEQDSGIHEDLVNYCDFIEAGGGDYNSRRSCTTKLILDRKMNY